MQQEKKLIQIIKTPSKFLQGYSQEMAEDIEKHFS
jgi:hypothetical protein